MLPLILAAVLQAVSPAAPAAGATPPAADQIAAAVLAAPADRRTGAMVLGYDDKGAVVTLRPGTNDIVCLADNPKDKAFSVACYHKDLEPYMARGRELIAQGMKDQESHETRWKEIADLYAMLESVAPSPLNTLNRAVAVAEWQGAASGLALLEGLAPPAWLAGSYLWDAVLADLHRRAGHAETSRHHRERAMRVQAEEQGSAGWAPRGSPASRESPE